MSLDKLVDSTQLDSDLTSVANAIRTKGGTSAQLAFPADFVTAIGNIPSGGGESAHVQHFSYTAASAATTTATGNTSLFISTYFNQGNGLYWAFIDNSLTGQYRGLFCYYYKFTGGQTASGASLKVFKRYNAWVGIDSSIVFYYDAGDKIDVYYIAESEIPT